MNYTKQQAEKSAQDEHNKGKRLQADADKKNQEINKLKKEIDSDRKKAKAMSFGGPAGALLGSGSKNHADKLQQKVTQLEHDMHHLQEQAKFAEKEAYNWEQKAKFAES